MGQIYCFLSYPMYAEIELDEIIDKKTQTAIYFVDKIWGENKLDWIIGQKVTAISDHVYTKKKFIKKLFSLKLRE